MSNYNSISTSTDVVRYTFGTGLREKMLESTTQFVLLTGRRNQHDKAWKFHAWVSSLIFSYVMYPARLKARSHGAIFLATCNAILLLRDVNL